MVDFTDQEEVLAEVLPSEPARPKKITIVVVIAIILALLYLMGFLSAIPTMIMHVVSPGGFNFAPNADDPQFKMQAAMQASMAEVTRTYFIPLILLSLASLGVGSFLLYSSIQIFRRGLVSDYRLLNKTIIFAIVLVVANTIVTIMIQWANWNALNTAIVENDTGAPAELMKNIMMISMVIGIGMGFVFQVAKLVYFALARWILGHYITTLEKS